MLHETITISCPSTGTSASIVPSRGMNCIEFSTVFGGDLVEVIDSEDGFLSGQGRPTRSGIPILFPYPNRIANGKYTWDGKDYTLPIQPGRKHSMHGFAFDVPWRVLEKTQTSLTAVFQLSVDAPNDLQYWPADCMLTVTYEVSHHKLISKFVVTNPDTKPLPWALGTHAYFRVPLVDFSEPKNCLIQLPVAKQYAHENEIPTGESSKTELIDRLTEGEYFDTLKLDDLFSMTPPPSGHLYETKIMDEKAGLEMVQRYSQDFPFQVMFTPEGRNCICMEPYTCLSNAINNPTPAKETGWQVLAPGQSKELLIELEVQRVIA